MAMTVQFTLMRSKIPMQQNLRERFAPQLVAGAFNVLEMVTYRKLGSVPLLPPHLPWSIDIIEFENS